MDSWLVLLVILGLATARITALLVYDDIAEGFRHAVFRLSPPEGDEHGPSLYQLSDWRGRPLARDDGDLTTLHVRRAGFLGRMLSCHFCTGLWVALIVAVAYTHLDHDLVFNIALVFAIAQVADVATKVAR